jgi:hypothetical protein
MCVPVTVAVRNTVVSAVKYCIPTPRALLKPSIQNTIRVQPSAYCAENIWRCGVLLNTEPERQQHTVCIYSHHTDGLYENYNNLSNFIINTII